MTLQSKVIQTYSSIFEAFGRHFLPQPVQVSSPGLQVLCGPQSHISSSIRAIIDNNNHNSNPFPIYCQRSFQGSRRKFSAEFVQQECSRTYEELGWIQG